MEKPRLIVGKLLLACASVWDMALLSAGRESLQSHDRSDREGRSGGNEERRPLEDKHTGHCHESKESSEDWAQAVREIAVRCITEV